jgi:tetratricopeptide (TPR) repeat protein
MAHDNNLSFAMHSLEIALELSRSGGESTSQAEILSQLGWARWKIGDYQGTQKYAAESKAVAAASGNIFAESRALRTESLACRALGKFQHSLQLCHRARHLLNLCGLFEGDAHDTLKNTEAEIHVYKSEYAEARRIHSSIAEEVSREQSTYSYALALQNVAAIDVLIGGDAQAIRRTLDKAQLIFNMMGHPTGKRGFDIALADLDLREGSTLSARSQFEKCLTSAWGKDDDHTVYCLQRLGDVTLWHTEGIDWIEIWATIYLAHAQKSQSKLEIYEVLRCLGNIYLIHGDQDTAHSLFTLALEGFTQMDIHRSRGNCLLWLGDIARQKGDVSKAVEIWSMARPLFERSLQTKQIQQIDKWVHDADLTL